MTVAELIEQLKQMPQDVHVYAEGELADKVIFEENPDGNDGIVRIFKAWDIKFVGRGIEPQESEEVGSLSYMDGTFIISAEEMVESEEV